MENTFLGRTGLLITVPLDDPEETQGATEEFSPPCVAVLADLIRSRAYSSPTRRAEVQESLRALLDRFNEEFGSAVISKFLITAGDEVQGVLSKPDVLSDFIWLLEEEFTSTDVRFGIGFGHLHTRVRAKAVGMDGPAFH